MFFSDQMLINIYTSKSEVWIRILIKLNVLGPSRLVNNNDILSVFILLNFQL